MSSLACTGALLHRGRTLLRPALLVAPAANDKLMSVLFYGGSACLLVSYKEEVYEGISIALLTLMLCSNILAYDWRWYWGQWKWEKRISFCSVGEGRYMYICKCFFNLHIQTFKFVRLYSMYSAREVVSNKWWLSLIKRYIFSSSVLRKIRSVSYLNFSENLI